MALSNEIEDLFDEVIDIQEEAENDRENKNIDYVIEKVGPEQICVNDFNKVYDKFNSQSADEELQQSLCEHGLLENLVVTPNDSPYDTHYVSTGCKYRLISGHRRLKAIQAIVKNSDSETARRFMMIPVKVEKYSSPEEELLMLNTYNLHSRTLSAEDKLLLLSEIRNELEVLLADKELTEKQKLIRKELKKYKSIFEGMARATQNRYFSISANGNPEVAKLISEGFTIHQLAKIANFPGKSNKPLHSLLSPGKLELLSEILDQTGDLQQQVLDAVTYLKENGLWSNDLNIKLWRNYIVNEFVIPINQNLQTAKSNCSAYNLAETTKDKENALSKIKHQINNMQKICETFKIGYETGDLKIFEKQANTKKSVVDKFSSNFRKINDKEEMLKILKSLIVQAKEADVIDGDASLQIMNLL